MDKRAQVQGVLEQYPVILAAYLHGSTAKGTARPDSDVDLALLSTRNLIFAKEVIDNGQETFTVNRFQSDLFMATALAMYVEHQERWDWALESCLEHKTPISD